MSTYLEQQLILNAAKRQRDPYMDLIEKHKEYQQTSSRSPFGPGTPKERFQRSTTPRLQERPFQPIDEPHPSLDVPTMENLQSKSYPSYNSYNDKIKTDLLQGKVIGNVKSSDAKVRVVPLDGNVQKYYNESSEDLPSMTSDPPDSKRYAWTLRNTWERVFLGHLLGFNWQDHIKEGNKVQFPRSAEDLAKRGEEAYQLQLLTNHGAFNLLFKAPPNEIARRWADEGVWPPQLADLDESEYVIRITRFDKHSSTDRGAFKTTGTILEEVCLALNAGAVEIGPLVHAALVFDTGITRNAATKETYMGSILVMKRMTRDVNQWLDSVDTSEKNPNAQWRAEVGTVSIRMLDMFSRLGSNRIAHFDLKPNNILLDQDMQPYIIDFEPVFYKVSQSKYGTRMGFALVNALLFLSHVRAFHSPVLSNAFVGAIRTPLLQIANLVMSPLSKNSEFDNPSNQWIHTTRMPTAEDEGFTGTHKNNAYALGQTYLEIVNHYFFDTPLYRSWLNAAKLMQTQFYKNATQWIDDMRASDDTFFNTVAGKEFKRLSVGVGKVDFETTRDNWYGDAAKFLALKVKDLIKKQVIQPSGWQQDVAVYEANVKDICTQAGRPRYAHHKPMWDLGLLDSSPIPLTRQLLRYVVFFEYRIGQSGTPSTSLTDPLNFDEFTSRPLSR